MESGKQPPSNTALGGELLSMVMAGSDWTNGSIAVDDEVMDVLWDYCKIGTEVTIYK